MSVPDASSEKSAQFFAALETAFAEGTLVRLALRAYRGADPALKSLDVKPALIRKAPQLSFTWHYKTRDIVKNHPLPEAVAELRRLLGAEFGLAQLFTTGADFSLDLQGKTPRLRETAPSETAAPSLAHDREKQRPVAAARPWLHALGVTDAEGRVLPTAQDKYRQINRYVEILGPLLAAIPRERLKRVLDMGAGKGYLTFAVADHLATALHSDAKVTGVELRPDMVALGNRTAAASGLENLGFAEGSIDAFDSTGASALIALHACDTATDDAIAKGIAAGAELIVVAPCCHKQIRREVEAAEAGNPLGYLTRHGIFLERQCEMVTDGIRALVLEYFGYSTKVFEFISDQHTPKNVLIVGQRTGRANDPAVLAKIAEAKAFFGIRRHHLETATGLAA